MRARLRPSTSAAIRRRLASQRGPDAVAQPRGARRERRVPRVPRVRVPAAGGRHPRGRHRPARLLEADERLAGARGPRRLHEAAGGAHRPVRQAARAASCSGSRSTSPPRCRSAASASASSSRATRVGRPRSKATRRIPRAWAPATSRRRARCSGSTIPIARRWSPARDRSGPGRAWSTCSARCARGSAPRAVRAFASSPAP